MNKLVFVGDFETTVYDGQQNTEVWASAVVQIGTEDVQIFHSISETFEYLASFKQNVTIYYHNLKFDGEFWMYYLINVINYKQASNYTEDSPLETTFMSEKDMPKKSFKYSISDMGQWYSITIKTTHNKIEIRDSLKLLPFSVAQIGKSFATKHKKLDMDYSGFRYAGCVITDEEKRYIANDVLVVKEALEIMFNQGHDKITIGSCCLSEFKKGYSKDDYADLFPDLTTIQLNPDLFDAENADQYVRKSYKGGWCYLVKGKESKKFKNGTTADVNSLYPSMMSSESNNRYPYGLPVFWSGNYIPDEALMNNRYYFIRLKTHFNIKKNYLPFIQVKDNLFYKSTECLETSKPKGRNGEYIDKLFQDGVEMDTRLTLTLTMTDYILLIEHYDLIDCEILDGCYFWASTGMFDRYIEKYKKIKMESKGAIRTLAKLFLNNLYGKMATSDISSFKYAYTKESGAIGYITIPEHNKKVGYIPVGSAITSYARNFTIRAAQKNYHGVNKRGFIYADTDSIHCDLKPDEIQGITVDETNFCCWKLESSWDVGYFVRQKTYIEHVVAEDLEPIEEPYYSVKCAGMPEKCKDLFVKSMTNYKIKDDDKFTDEEIEFIQTKRTIDDFNYGLCVPGKLIPRRIIGGVLLTNTYYQMRRI